MPTMPPVRVGAGPAAPVTVHGPPHPFTSGPWAASSVPLTPVIVSCTSTVPYVNPLANVPVCRSVFVTTTSHIPAACAPLVAVIVVALTTTTLVADVPHSVTVAP